MTTGLPEYLIRAAGPDDKAFLRALFVSHRGLEFQGLPLPSAQLEALFDQQFEAQQSQYHANHPDGEFGIIVIDGSPAGCLTVSEGERIELVEIALMPEFRGSGIGSRIVQSLLDRAKAARKDVVLSVQVFNPAFSLYQRLGFEVMANDGMYISMRWRP